MSDTTIQIRRDTAANWFSVNPILADGELGLDQTSTLLRVGDGVTAWNSLTGKFLSNPATTSLDGYLTSTDWNTFNSKQPAITWQDVTAGSTKITLGGTPTGSVFSAFSIDVVEANLTISNMSGTLAISHGGTGLTTVAQGDLFFASVSGPPGTPVISRLAKNTSATRYLSNTGTSNNPAWAQVNLANGVTGQLLTANIADLAITTAKIADHAVGALQIGLNAVVYGNLQQMSATTLLGNASSGVSQPGEISVVAPLVLNFPGIGPGNLSITQSTTSTDGYLTSTDWNTFNSKQSALTGSQGDIIYFSATNTISNLAKNTTATRYLSNTGSSNNPAWAQINLANGVTGTLGVSGGGTGLGTFAQGDIIYASATGLLSALSKDTNTSRYLSNQGSSNNPVWGQINLANGVTGTLPVGNGGTGTATAFTAGSVIFAGASGVYSQSNANFFYDSANNRVGIHQTSPTAYLHIGAGTASASTAPLKFTSGTLLTTAEAGAVEFLTDKFYGTITTGAARKEFTLNDSALTSGRVPFSTTNGRLNDSGNLTYSGGLLTAVASGDGIWVLGGGNPSIAAVNAGISRAARFGLVTSDNSFVAGSLTDDAVFQSSNGNMLYQAGTAVFKFTSGGSVGFTASGVPSSITARLHLPAGAAAASSAPLKLTSGTNLTTAEAGAFEYNGTNLFFTRSGTTRETVITSSAVTTEVLTSDTSVTINIGGVTYKLLAKA